MLGSTFLAPWKQCKEVGSRVMPYAGETSSCYHGIVPARNGSGYLSPMMQALDAATGLTIAGAEARRGVRYLCPGCGALVGLGSGLRKVPHFAHFSTTDCQLSEPESPRHRALKWLCRTFFAPLPVIREAAIGTGRRAPV